MNFRRGMVIAGAVLLLSACGHDVEPSVRNSPSPSPSPPIRTVAPQFVYVGSMADNTISEFEIDGAKNAQIRTISAGVNQPGTLALDSQGNLYSANSGNNSITEYDPSGTLIRTITDVAAPMAVDANGNLYASKPNNGPLLMYPPGATTPSASAAISPTTFGASSVAIDSAGNVYVASWSGDVFSPPSSDHIATEYAPGLASVVRMLVVPGIPYVQPVNGTYRPGTWAVAANRHTGEIAVTWAVQVEGGYPDPDPIIWNVAQFAPGQTEYPSIANLNYAGQWSNAIEAAYDDSGDLFVLQQTSGIRVFPAAGGWAGSTTINCDPAAIATDGVNDLLEADNAPGVGVQVFTRAGGLMKLSVSQPGGIAATQE